MKRVTLADDSDGNSKGWNPNGSNGWFEISDPNVSSNSIIVANLAQTSTPCSQITNLHDGGFMVNCAGYAVPPPNGAELHYLIINLS
jgi:hypothetical protein